MKVCISVDAPKFGVIYFTVEAIRRPTYVEALDALSASVKEAKPKPKLDKSTLRIQVDDGEWEPLLP